MCPELCAQNTRVRLLKPALMQLPQTPKLKVSLVLWSFGADLKLAVLTDPLALDSH